MCAHPNIAALVGAHYDARHVYVLTDLSSSGTLRTALASTAPAAAAPPAAPRAASRCAGFPEHVAQFHAACALLALEHLRAHRVAHRDLRPEAFVLDARGYPKLSGFDCARVLGGGERAYTLCGSPEYMAPEVSLRRADGLRDGWPRMAMARDGLSRLAMGCDGLRWIVDCH